MTATKKHATTSEDLLQSFGLRLLQQFLQCSLCVDFDWGKVGGLRAIQGLPVMASVTFCVPST